MIGLACLLAALAVALAPTGRRLGRPTPAAVNRPVGAAVTSADVGECARLLASALRSGIGPLGALEVVADLGPPAARADLRRVAAAQEWGHPPQEAWALAGPGWDAVGAALVAADRAGLSPVRALEAAADQIARDRRARVVEAVGRLEVLVVLPLGLCFLPGFVLTTVVPLVVGLAADVLR